MFELLDSLPDTISFSHADELMQGLTQLSPKRIMELFSVCRSVKVKRLFLWYNHPWNKHLKREEIFLGSGKRRICENGVLETTYNITIPKEMKMSVSDE